MSSSLRSPILFLGLGALVGASAFLLMSQASPPSKPDLAGFQVQQIRFDESRGAKQPTPTIPKSWHLLAVANGEKINGNNLWFADADGSFYVVSVFTTANDPGGNLGSLGALGDALAPRIIIAKREIGHLEVAK